LWLQHIWLQKKILKCEDKTIANSTISTVSSSQQEQVLQAFETKKFILYDFYRNQIFSVRFWFMLNVQVYSVQSEWNDQIQAPQKNVAQITDVA
jgi:hypothetical protein